MKKVSQILPIGQVEILKEALSIMEATLKVINKNGQDMNLNHKEFDILTLKAMLNNTEVVINLPFDVYDRFTAINGVDFPEYMD